MDLYQSAPYNGYIDTVVPWPMGDQINAMLSCIARNEDVQSIKRRIGEVKGEVERKIEEVEDKVQGKIEEVEVKVQVKIGDLEKRISELEDRSINFPVNPEITYSRPTDISLTFDGQTSWPVFRTQFDVVSSANGWNNRVEFYRTELKTRRQKPGESLQALAANVKRLISLAYSECPQDVRDSLSAQYFVDAIRDEDTQHATRLMDTKDLKSALAYSMKYEAAKTVSKSSRNIRSIEIEDGTGKEKDEKFDCLLKTLEKLLNSHVVGKKNTPRLNPNVTCWKCNKKGTRTEGGPDDFAQQGKLMYDRLTGQRLPFLNKAHEEGLKVSALCGGRNGLHIEGSICSIPCLMLVDTGANVTLAATGEKAEIHGKLDAEIECGSTKFQHRIYVADITDPCILGQDFLQKFNFTVDLEKNEIRTRGQEIPLFSANAEHSKLYSVLAKEKSIIPARSECLIQGVPEVSGKFRCAVTDFPSQVSQKCVLVAVTLVDLKKEVIPVRVLNLDNKPKTVYKGSCYCDV
ncbi:hypothetical protein AVEN_209297-1 [Araneus ventricosus]|uniref:Peptidase A2 domain-containing protein n=1 Tax=Araneus ventricosus TaxID=182803 RepID=A0A4Y2CAL5_ARAVE|nr:hypothetical protein AVEN_209297-1 [Araneus ventricosus]